MALDRDLDDFLHRPLSLDGLRAWARGQHWHYAKTMPKNPHWYVPVEETVTPGEFYMAVATIRQLGYWARFGRKSNLHLDLDGWTYWTMGAPIRETRIINAAPAVDTLQKAVPPPEDRIPPRQDIPPRGGA